MIAMILYAMMLSSRSVFGEWSTGEVAAGLSGLGAGAIASFLLYRFVRRTPWPRPFRFSFILKHLAAVVIFGAGWILLSIIFESVFTGNLLHTRTGSRLIYLRHELPEISFLLYAIVTGIGYSVERRARIARIEADAARAQLAALRAQLHPHFLFNALHAVVQLIQVDPVRATEAAELVASLLRVTLEENRDEVALGDEWNFVSRYLEMEKIRFGDRLRIHANVSSDLYDEKVPSFALQTLVENAVRHGAEKSSAPTDIFIDAAVTGSTLNLSVRNEGNNLPAEVKGDGAGTGLSRLRERLSFLYGEDARLTSAPVGNGSYVATLTVPRRKAS